MDKGIPYPPPSLFGTTPVIHIPYSLHRHKLPPRQLDCPRMCTHFHTHANTMSIHYTHVYTHVHAHVYTRAHTHVHTHVCAHVCTHVCRQPYMAASCSICGLPNWMTSSPCSVSSRTEPSAEANNNARLPAPLIHGAEPSTAPVAAISSTATCVDEPSDMWVHTCLDMRVAMCISLAPTCVQACAWPCVQTCIWTCA